MADNIKPLDGWTFVHAAAGFMARRIGLSSHTTLALGITYELLEQALERDPKIQEKLNTTGPESLSNAVTDVVVMMITYKLTSARRARR